MRLKAIYNPKYRALVEFIRAARKKRGMTQSELGRRMRLSRQVVQKIEYCQIRLDLVRYVTLCRILGLKVGRLLGRMEEPSDEDDSFYLSDLYTRQESILSCRWKISGQFLTIFWVARIRRQEVILLANSWPLFAFKIGFLALFDIFCNLC